MKSLYDFLANDGTINALQNSISVSKGYNPYIPGDYRHELVKNYQYSIRKIEYDTLEKILNLIENPKQ